jgi:hypothetical protein
MMSVRTIAGVAVGLLALGGACSKKDEKAGGGEATKPTEITKSGDNTTEKVGLDTGGKALGGEKVKLNKLKLGGSGFEGEYNEALDSWKHEKWEPQKDGTNDNVVRIYVDGWNTDDWPTDVEQFATKLGTADFLDFGSKWPKIDAKTPFAGGWVITGEVNDGTDQETAFAVRLEKPAVLCRGYVKNTAKDKAKTLAESIEACKGITIGS